ncbi:MAG: 50S ribosomal protein L6 [Candidatus Wildermuthbacteria bacterium RIFCSPHIGHO2_02_FULL_49_9]|uniref:Large ribosomal subunit protein uL6 n=2 Tax=Candidatus Wildermuthiibacteriota TaxID=1817923 RepID=A0A1G2QWI5_9BACT|nr:MAG: 50S ribosomal protein L6 [Candidatus Wildermuthbacteria bacterium RIFCSPHIGHO2_01_FULL_49_22b]OHA70078.1 MAG: 50S ribosomal protein L6 [Candidatus Wildermuthbacteria bacterium RIFCSPHIGHO2_02_FULL_49_9]
MSRIGKKPIELPSGVDAVFEEQGVRVKGPKGELQGLLPPELTARKEDSRIIVSLKEKLLGKRTDRVRALWGLTRTLLSNMVQGVSQGYEKRLELEGTGYRAAVEGDSLVLSLGFSKPVEVKLPEGIVCRVEKNVIAVSGISKELVGEFAARIRRLRPVEPYKGKGIRYEGEVVRRKEGKKAAGAVGTAAG